MTVSNGAGPWWWGGNSQGRLFAFDMTTVSSPVYLSEVKFAADAWSIGRAFAGDGAIYASHAGAVADGTGTDQGWAEGWFLDVIDFSVPAAPVVRDPVSIPTTLIGVGNATTSSATLLTVGWHIQDQSNGGQFLDACMYDSALATLLDSVALAGWSAPAVFDGGNVFVGQSSDNSGGSITGWMLSGDNKFTLLASVRSAAGHGACVRLAICSLPKSMEGWCCSTNQTPRPCNKSVRATVARVSTVLTSTVQMAI